MPQTFEGGCHCGRVRFRVTADLDRVTECNCSICSKKGFLHLIVPPEQFELIQGKDDLTTYRFNTGTAQHTFCKHLRHASVLCAALRPGQDRRQCPLSGRHGRRDDPDQDIRRPQLGRPRCRTRCPGDDAVRARRRDPRRPASMQVRVYYEDTDFSGAVYHASYLRFMERGRTNYLRLLGADQRALFEETEKEAPGFAFVVRTCRSSSSSRRGWTTCSRS